MASDTPYNLIQYVEVPIKHPLPTGMSLFGICPHDQTPSPTMQKSQSTTGSHEQRLLRLKFTVQHARMHKVKEYLEALENDLQELEDTMSHPSNIVQDSHRRIVAISQSAADCLRMETFNDAPTGLSVANISRPIYDPDSHALICEQLSTPSCVAKYV